MSKKKEKIIYYDDNSTIADMSKITPDGKKQSARPPRMRSTVREKWNTYWSAVRMMIVPMCVALAALALIYLAIMLSSGNL
jgi:hypothetical protein